MRGDGLHGTRQQTVAFYTCTGASKCTGGRVLHFHPNSVDTLHMPQHSHGLTMVLYASSTSTSFSHQNCRAVSASEPPLALLAFCNSVDLQDPPTLQYSVARRSAQQCNRFCRKAFSLPSSIGRFKSSGTTRRMRLSAFLKPHLTIITKTGETRWRFDGKNDRWARWLCRFLLHQMILLYSVWLIP